MTDRRYTDEEVAAILLRAAEGPQHPVVKSSRDDRLTLPELQQIGREVGLPPEAVALAAQSVDQSPQGVSQTMLGLPTGVEQRIVLHR